MAKVYTSQEMREMADEFCVSGVISEVKDEDGRVVKQIKNDAIIAMLRQAANAMEREKKYQYAVKCNGNTIYANCNGDAIYNITTNACRARSSVKELKAEGFINPRLVRREVGEWEEVK